MIGYVDMFFTHFIDYFNKFWENPLIQYLTAIFIVISVIGLLRKLIHINS